MGRTKLALAFVPAKRTAHIIIVLNHTNASFLENISYLEVDNYENN